MRNRKLVLTLIYLLLPAISSASDSLQKQLTEQYRDKVLALRHSFKANSQEYDDAGNPIALGDEGPWTVYGRMSVKKVAVNDKVLRLEGRRVVYVQDKKGFIPAVDREDVRIAIRLKAPLTTLDQADAIINLVVNSPADIVNSAPSYWHDYLRRQTTPQESKQQGSQQAKSSENPAIGERGIYSITDKGVTPPKALFSPEPDFSSYARARRYQGSVGVSVIVDKTGGIRNVQIIRPLGMGLDENAVNTVRTWRFSPAMLNGEPVAVQIYVEFDFHLQ